MTKTTRHLPRTVRGIALLALVLPLIGVGTAASASTATSTPAIGTVAITTNAANISTPGIPVLVARELGIDDGSVDPTTQSQWLYESPYRTLARWGDATNAFHTKYDGFVGTQVVDQAQRNLIQGGMMSVGNFFEKATSDLSRMAATFDVVDAVGKPIDDATAVLLNALFRGAGGAAATILIVGALVVAVGVVLFQAMRMGGWAVAVRRLGGIALVMALLFGMTAQALNSSGNSTSGGEALTSDNAGKYDPAPLTPGWIVKTLNGAISTLADAPAAAFVAGVGPTTWAPSSGTGNLSCARMTTAMGDSLRFTQDGLSATGVAGARAVAMTSIMDSLWNITGLQTWAQVQTGYTNPYGAEMYCRILDIESAKVRPAGSALLTARGQGGGGWVAAVTPDASKRMPFAPDSTEATNATYVAWAACEATGLSGSEIQWKWRSGWEGFQGGDDTLGKRSVMEAGNAQAECSKWWNTASTDDAKQDAPQVFRVSGDRQWIIDRSAGAQNPSAVSDFLLTITGTDATAGTSAAGAYAVSAVGQFLAFGTLSLLTFLAKLFGAVFIVGFWFVLFGSLFTRSPFKERILKSGGQLLGITLFASLLTLVMSFVVIFTRVLIEVGNIVAGSGSLFSLIWAGFAPFASLLVVHYLFTKVFRLPSPVSINGARAWGRVMGSPAAASALGAGLGSFVGSRVSGATKNAGKAMANGLLSKATGVRFGGASTRSRMGAGPRTARDVAADASEALLEGKGKLSSNAARAAASAGTGAAAGAVVSGLVAAGAAGSRREARRTANAELAAAREHYKQTNNTSIVPGDLKGALSAATGAAAGAVGERGRAALASAQSKMAATPIGQELTRRSEYRAALRDARMGGDRQALEEARQEQRARLTTAQAGIAAVLDAPGAVAARASLGVDAIRSTSQAGSAAVSAAAGAVWNSSPVAAARKEAAAVSSTARMASTAVRTSSAAEVAALATQRAGRVATVVGTGGRALAQRKQNNAQVLREYREATQAAALASAARDASSGRTDVSDTARRAIEGASQRRKPGAPPAAAAVEKEV